MRKGLARVAAGLLVAALAGCSGGGGGGGGGGAGGAGGSDTPLTYIGVTSAANISVTNAGSITANVVGSGDVSQAISLAAVAPESGTIDVGRALQRSVRALTKPRTAKFTSAIPFDENFDCDSGSVHVFGTLNDNGTGTLQVQYNACQTGAVTASGSGSLRVDVFDLGLEIPTDFTINLVRLTLSGSVAGEVSGTLRARLDTPSSGITITTTENLVARFGSGTMTKSENLEYVDVFNASGFVERVSGRVFHSTHGFVDITTTVAFRFDTFSQDFPSDGLLVLTGANGAAIRVKALSTSRLSLELDLDGNGVFDKTVVLAWVDLGGAAGADLDDDDRDGMHNSWEDAHGLDRKSGADATKDADGDGATNLLEYQAGTDPQDPKSIPPGSTLSVVARADSDIIAVGGRLTYVIDVLNSNLPANDVVLVNSLPDNITLESANISKGTCSGTAPLTCTIGTVNNFDTPIRLVIVVSPTADGILTNTTTVSTSSFDAVKSDNSVTIVTSVGLAVTGLQSRIDAAAQTGATILVDPGLYVGQIDFRQKDILLQSTGGPAVTILHSGGGSVVRMGPGGAITGFTITGSATLVGSGIVVEQDGSHIFGNVFDGNAQPPGGTGAAIGSFGGSPIIERNIFRNNTCDDAFTSGVVSFVNLSSPRIVDNVFVNNACRAINMTLTQSSSPQVINNTFVGNRAAILVDRRSSQGTQIYRNNIIFKNGIGLQTTSGTDADNPIWTNNLVSANTVQFSGTAAIVGSGNINSDTLNPLFVNQAGGNFDLLAGSPAINAGSDLGAPAVDFEGTVRVSPVDIGAFEGP